MSTMPTILAMDANANPFGEGKGDDPSVWKAFMEIKSVASVWEGHLDASQPPVSHGGSAPEAPVSMNKMRGPASGQPTKIGLHAYQLIDHMFYSKDSFSEVRHVLEPK